MYKIGHFEDKFCGGDCCGFDNNNNCGVYSIWQFCFWNRWQSLKQLVFYTENLSFCQPEWFSLNFWLSLVICFAGIYNSTSEFLAIYCGAWTIKIEEKYGENLDNQVFSAIFRRNARLIGSAVMVKAWTGLLIGIVTVTPSAISTFLAIFSVTIFLDLILWIRKILFVESKLDFRTCCKHLLPVGTLLMVRCIHAVFIREIERRTNIDELKLTSKLTKKW